MSSRRFVVNASPVIFLTQIQKLPLLKELSAPGARPLVENLRRKGLYLSQELVDAALGEIGE